MLEPRRYQFRDTFDLFSFAKRSVGAHTMPSRIAPPIDYARPAMRAPVQFESVIIVPRPTDKAGWSQA